MTAGSGLDPGQFRDFIIRPALEHIGLWSMAAGRMVLGTALTESGLVYIDQIDKAAKPGPAYGPFQMERFTHDDLWNTVLKTNKTLAMAVRDLMCPGIDACTQMHGNHFYAAAMCRVFYYRLKDKLPPEDDLEAMAQLWKLRYNTLKGAGKIEDFMKKALPMMNL